MNQVNTGAKDRNKLLAFLLAVILGPLGIHNFYLGRWKRGIIQFGLVLLTFGAGLLITFPWAWAEAFGILIGKYSLGPKKPVDAGSEGEETQIEKNKVSPLKEYLIATILLLPLLALSIPTFGIPLLFAAVFYLIVGGLWNKITKIFIKSVLPLYATIFSGGKKFLIRFSEYTMPPTNTRAELFRATRKLSLTAVFVLFFLISLIAQSNISMVTEGDIPDAVVCDDGTVELYGACDDESDGTFCDPDCVMNNSSAIDRIMEAYTSAEIALVLLFAPFITVLIAPILVLRFSSLSIVDKDTRSMVPIGQNANDLTKVTAGFGSIVIFFQTALGIATAATEDGNIGEAFYFVFMILLMTVILVLAFYPLIWLPMLKFTKSFDSHVLLLDNSLVKSKGIEVHQLTYDNNELRITPVHQTDQSNPPHSEESIKNQAQPVSLQHVEEPMIDVGPPIDAVSNNKDEHGFEWIVHNEDNYYRKIDTTEQWMKFQN
jgi:TM2 domain-containing membrane protein YozV